MDNQHQVKTPENVQIRPARVEDVPVILQLIRDLATYERAPDEVVATEEQLVDVLFGERPAAEVLLAFEGKSPVGFAVYFYSFSTWLGRPGLYLEDLFVKPEKRGRGYGRALLVELAKIARDRGCGRMEWAVLNWNEPAIKFYQALGAKPMNEWTVFRLTRDEIARLANDAGRHALSRTSFGYRKNFGEAPKCAREGACAPEQRIICFRKAKGEQEYEYDAEDRLEEEKEED